MIEPTCKQDENGNRPRTGYKQDNHLSVEENQAIQIPLCLGAIPLERLLAVESCMSELGLKRAQLNVSAPNNTMTTTDTIEGIQKAGGEERKRGKEKSEGRGVRIPLLLRVLQRLRRGHDGAVCCAPNSNSGGKI